MPPGRKPGSGFPVTDPERLAAWGRIGGPIGGATTRRRYGRAHYKRIGRLGAAKTNEGKAESKQG